MSHAPNEWGRPEIPPPRPQPSAPPWNPPPQPAQPPANYPPPQPEPRPAPANYPPPQPEPRPAPPNYPPPAQIPSTPASDYGTVTPSRRERRMAADDWAESDFDEVFDQGFDDGYRQGNKKKKSSGAKVFSEWVILIVAALGIALLLKSVVVGAYFIPSQSMVPTLEIDDRVLVNKLSYRFQDVKRGDIVVFDAPPVEKAQNIDNLVKRVVGLPGETIKGEEGSVWVKDSRSDEWERLAEDYLPATTRQDDFGPKEIPAGSFFMMGDNRLESKDSRSFGTISEDQIVGRVLLRYWPLGRFGLP